MVDACTPRLGAPRPRPRGALGTTRPACAERPRRPPPWPRAPSAPTPSSSAPPSGSASADTTAGCACGPRPRRCWSPALPPRCSSSSAPRSSHRGRRPPRRAGGTTTRAASATRSSRSSRGRSRASNGGRSRRPRSRSGSARSAAQRRRRRRSGTAWSAGRDRLLVDRAALPRDASAFAWQLARDTWRGLDALTDREHGLPVDNVRLGRALGRAAPTRTIGDYTSTSPTSACT